MYIEKKLDVILRKLEKIEIILGNGTSPGVLAVDIKQASELIGIGTTNTRKMVKQGILKGYKEGKKIMIPMKSVEDFITWRTTKQKFGNV